jgi:peptide deformylase
MAVLPIRVVPDPVLRQKSKRLKNIDSSVKKLAGSMLETIHAVPGRAGLAAPQVGELVKVIVFGLAEDGSEDVVLINPEIIERKGEKLVTEACLSVPGYYGELKRADKVKVKGRDLNGKEIRIKADEFLAQLLQHEIDHLNGVLYIDRLANEGKLYKVESRTPQL